MVAKLGDLILSQVERSKGRSEVVVHFAATIPGDGSQVSADWWLREMNTALRGAPVPIPFSLEFADLDHPTQIVSDGESSAIKVTQLKHKILEMQAYIKDLEDNMNEKAAALAESMLDGAGAQNAGLSKKETALRAVEQDGYYLDAQKARWVDIATEAKRLGKSYITVWRACKGIGIHKAVSWVVGETQAGGERLLIKQGSFTTGKRRKKGAK
jgi:hypothetical protein